MEDVHTRLSRLERLVFMLAEGLTRQGTEVDGNWGNPPSRFVFGQVAAELNHVFMAEPPKHREEWSKPLGLTMKE